MKYFVLCVTSLLSSLAAAQPQSFEEDGLWGYRIGSHIVIETQFRMALDFLDSGIGAVVDDSGWVYIDTSGTRVIRPHVVDNGPDPFVEGLARFIRHGKMGFFDTSVDVVIEAEFDYAEPFSEGLAAVCQGCIRVFEGEHAAVEGGRWGYIDRSGCVVVPLRYEAAEPFADGTARVKAGGGWIEIDREAMDFCRSR